VAVRARSRDLVGTPESSSLSSEKLILLFLKLEVRRLLWLIRVGSLGSFESTQELSSCETWDHLLVLSALREHETAWSRWTEASLGSVQGTNGRRFPGQKAARY